MGEVKQIHATDAKPGRYVVFDGKACVVKNLDISRPGKHGHAKARIAAASITDGSKIIKVFPGHDKVAVPIIEKETAQVLSIAGDKANVMDMKSYETFDLNIPEDLKDQVNEGDQVNYWIILGKKVLRSK